MRLSIILLLAALRCQLAHHFEFHPSNSSSTHIPFTTRHHNSASFVTARQQYGCMPYIPLPYFLFSRKRPFQNPIHNGLFLMLILLSGDIHVNPGPINGYSTYPSSPPPYNFAPATPPPPSSIPSTAAAPPPPPPPSTPSAATAVHSGPPPPPPSPPGRHHHPPADSTNNKLNYAL